MRILVATGDKDPILDRAELRDVTAEEMAIELRKRGFLVIETPWPEWAKSLPTIEPIRSLEWLWAHQHVDSL